MIQTPVNDTPRFAIIGRPNVGKSTLFNLMTDSRKSVVKDQAGVTRDILIEPIEFWGKQSEIIDTGGITEAKDLFSQMIREQVTEFLQGVDYLLVVMDGRAGLIPEDRELIRLAKSTGRDFIIIVNKVDSGQDEGLMTAEFHEFGVDVIATSFEQRRGLSNLLEWMAARIPENTGTVKEGKTIAIVGKPNAGKSSLCNQLLGENRMLVTPIAGTTIDSVDTPLIYNGKKYVLVDTAGLRKPARRDEHLEVISAFKAQESIRRADLVLLMVDATVGPKDQDAKILQAIIESHKGVILVANKSDIAKETPEFKKKFKEEVEQEFHFFTDIPIIFTSAKTGHGMSELFDEIERVADKLDFKISTSELNEFFFETIRRAPAPVWGTTNVKFYYLTQTFQKPPAFIAFANHPDGVSNAYRRFLIKHMKDRWDLWGIPIRVFVMRSHKGGGGGDR